MGIKHAIRIAAAAFFAAILALPAAGQEVKIKNIADLVGVRDNQIQGVGLITGLNGTGDGSEDTRAAVVNLLRKNNLHVDPNEVALGNVALVMVTATLPPFSRSGTRIDVLVSTLGDASSLYGGYLVQTPLKGAATNDTYAVAAGPISIGGFAAAGQAASVQKNHSTVGGIPNGAIVEREVPMKLVHDARKRTLLFSLKNPDFTTASRMAEAISARFEGAAVALDSTAVEVKIPQGVDDDKLIGFLAEVQSLTLRPDAPSRVIINERTGTIVAGAEVRISTVAITHGSLIITIAESPEPSQPQPFARKGETVVVPRTDLNVSEEPAEFSVIPGNASVSDLAQALNAIGATPRDLVTIFQLIKRAGALHADLELM